MNYIDEFETSDNLDLINSTITNLLDAYRINHKNQLTDIVSSLQVIREQQINVGSYGIGKMILSIQDILTEKIYLETEEVIGVNQGHLNDLTNQINYINSQFLVQVENFFFLFI